MDEVAEEHPHARLFVAGEGPERQHLEGLSGPNVKLLGKVRNAQEVMAASDLFVVPSIRAGFSMAAAEAMNIGVPVLMRNVDGLAEMADEGVSAIYFESDSGLGEAIKNALSMPLMMESISSAAKVRAALRFDIQDCAEGIASTYRSVLE
jgi:glycogen(starch) synthase